VSYLVAKLREWSQWNGARVIPLERRRRIRRCASKLLTELKELGTLDAVFADTLRELAGPEPDWRTDLQGKAKQGGDRRSGERSLEGSVLAMAVGLYCDACAKPGFSRNGPLVRFVNLLGELALERPEPFPPDAIKAAFHREKREATRIPGSGLVYNSEPEHSG